MKRTVFLLAALMIAGIGFAEALTLDVLKSDIQANANTKDDVSITLSVSVEYETNISSTSQVKSNIKGITEMAVLKEVAKYNFTELEANKQIIQTNILSYLREKSPGLEQSSVFVLDVAITDIINRQTPQKQPLQFQEGPIIPLWVYPVVFFGAVIIYFLYMETKKDEK